MNEEKYLKDISDIKTLMEQSSRFNALSSLSGIISGIYALIGAAIAYQYVEKNSIKISELSEKAFFFLFSDLILIIVLSLITSVIITKVKSKQNNINSFSIITKKMLSNFFIILFPAGIYILTLILNHDFSQAGSLMLFFYGAALINASHNTFKEVKTLGFIEIILGTLAVIFSNYVFEIWLIGAGFVHIIFGILMYFKHGKNNSN